MRSAPSILGAWFAFTLAGVAGAQGTPPDTAARVSFGGFVDGYYAWDFGQPPTFDRSFAGGTLFTTQPARHNEFNVNLAFVEAKLDGARLRGRLALQAGTSVQSNYSGEPANGQVSDPSLARHLQEAVVGVRLAHGLWVDGGIFFSHVGMEGWISRDNPTYTRSLVAEYSPYYQSGVKLTWAASPRLTAQLDVVNGWQNISENNSGKGAGIRLEYAPAANATISYYDLVSDEAGNRLRIFNGVGAKVTAGRATLLGEVDVGTQGKSAPDGGTATWYGFTAIARIQVAPAVALSGRVERFDDESRVIIATGTRTNDAPNPAFRANGGSLGIDISPQPHVLWRTELRGFVNRAALFPDGARGEPRNQDGFVVSSLAVTF
jgi:putative OmpL-like beta-barrel porin-2